MKNIVVGIDLGTTNSVIAVPGQYPDHGVVFGAVTVLSDEFDRHIHASAVCRVDGEIVTGDDAKEMAAQGYTPVRFVKKYMGTERRFLVGDQEWSPDEVSAQVLRHLCRIAETKLGVKVTGAVITHPAYFDGLAINATQRAGRLADLNVAALLMEPVAAAMAYCSEDARSHLRVLVYDLGGGTFDVTLVERSGTAFLPVGFGGDRELGGYNFDKKIATRMLAGLREKGYRLDIDADQPERDARWATLMHHAEKIKFALSAPDATKATARVSGVFKDDSAAPKSVQLNFSMGRQEFLDLIEPEIKKTLRETRKVLESANLTPGDLDYLVLVGGSSRIAAIQDRLQQEFGLQPQFDDDVLDLSVAVGAAMVAADAGTTEQGVTLARIPEETCERTVAFRGTVERTAQRADVAGLTVALRSDRGEESTLTSADGKFYLEAELNEERDNQLLLTITDKAGKTFHESGFSVRHSADSAPSAEPEPPKAMLPKAISVETVDGFSELAAEGVNLPFRAKKSFQTIDEVQELSIDIYQQDIQLTTILLSGFSQPVPQNCRVELEIEIGADYRMTATALVPSASIQKTQEFQLKPLEIPSTDELRRNYQEIRQMFDSQLENTPDGEQKARLGAEADLVIEEIEELFSAEFPEQLQLYMLIKKLYVLTKQLSLAGGLNPPKSVMDAKFQTASERLASAEARKPAIREQNYGAILDTLRAESQRAYQSNDAAAWAQISAKMDEILGTLEDTGPVALPPSPILRMFVIQQIAETRGEVAARSADGRLAREHAARCNQELDAAEQKVNGVDLTNDEAAKQQLVVIYQQHVMTAQRLAGVVVKVGSMIRQI